MNTRFFKVASTFILLIIFFQCLASPALAVLSTEPVGEEKIDRFISSRNVTLLREEPPAQGIQCFAISTNGSLALGIGNHSTGVRTVLVYDQSFTFMYGYTFEHDGGYGLDFDGENLVVYLRRSLLEVVLSDDGRCLGLGDIEDTPENDFYWNHTVCATEKEWNGCTYSLGSHLGPLRPFLFYYSELTRMDAGGNITVLYRVSEAKNLLILGGVAVFVLCCGCGVFIQVRRSIRKGRTAHRPL